MKTRHAVNRPGRRRLMKRTFQFAGAMIAVTVIAIGFPVHHDGTRPVDRAVHHAAGTPVKTDAEQRPPAREWSVTDVITNLPGCDGIAIDPATRDVYVSLEDQSWIVRIRPDGSRQTIIDASTPIWHVSAADVRPTCGMRSPEGLALDRNSLLYAVEDTPGGRLLCFDLSRLDQGAAIEGQEVVLPFDHDTVAWESIDAGSDGELLLAGSGLEGFRAGSSPDALFGIVVYRDNRQQWWMLLHTMMDGYSAVSFSPDQSYAFFCSETSGAVGCIDLRSRMLKTLFASRSLDAPESVCSLPDGSALVAEESGGIHRYDPIFGTVDDVLDMSASIETVCVDQDRLLISKDVEGEVVRVNAGMSMYSAQETRTVPPFFAEHRDVALPQTCPDYLRGALKKGGYDSDSGRSPSFAEFARRTSLVAMYASATPLDRNAHGGDPFRTIQFMVLYPDMFGVDMGRLLGPVSGFAAVTASNHLVRTRSFDRRLIHYDIEEGLFDSFNNRTIALPFPVGAHVTPDGVAGIHFIGGGETPDFHIVMNMAHPEQSFMACYPLGGAVELYRLSLPPGLGPDQWIAALPCDEPPQWKQLSPGDTHAYGTNNR